MAHCVPHRIVHDDEENRQVVQGGSMVDGGWITEEIGAITDDGNDRSLGSRELGAERGARPPTQTRGGARTEVAVGVFEPAMRQAERVLVDDDRTWILCLMEAVADPGRMDGAPRGDEFTGLLPRRCQGSSLLDDACPPFRYRCLRDLPQQRVCQRLEDRCCRAGDTEIASKPSYGNMRKQRVE